MIHDTMIKRIDCETVSADDSEPQNVLPRLENQVFKLSALLQIAPA